MNGSSRERHSRDRGIPAREHSAEPGTSTPEGLVIVDKPPGWSSHDVVARVRRLAATRKVGHAGTLDPMATGVLVVGVRRATKLLGHLALTDKSYDATIRLGASTVTDDAEGEVVASADASGITESDVKAGLRPLTGEIQQVPSAVSAVKIDGVRSYKRARAGETVEIAPRAVTVHRLEAVATRHEQSFLDVDVEVECSSGTYVRALARDVGAALGVGGHLTSLRRTQVGPYGLPAAHTLDQLAERFDHIPLADAAAAAFPRIEVDAETALRVAHGIHLPPTGHGTGPVAVFGPNEQLLALVEDHGPRAKYLAVFA